MKNLFRILLLVSFFYCYLLLLTDSNSETQDASGSGNTLTAGVSAPPSLVKVK